MRFSPRFLHRLAFATILLAIFCTCGIAAESERESGVYELRIYTCAPGKLDALHARFKNHTMALFEKHGMENIAYWTPVAEGDSDPRLIYLLRHASREAAKASWAGFIADEEWKQVAAASREEHGQILAKRPESIFMVATDYSPRVPLADPKKLYELRIYTAAEGKLEALNARFRDHTDKIFARHGMQSFGYWAPLDEPQSANTLIYVLEYENRDAASAGWKAFASDPEWKAARAESEKDGRLLSTRPESVYMTPTDYSPVKE